MLIRYHGHAEFLLETADGLRILTDPFPDKVPWPYFGVQADVITSSHDHWDHCYFDKVPGDPAIVNDLEPRTVAPGVRITGYPSFHDDAQGALRGPNTIFIIQAEGLRIAHLGDLGAVPADHVLKALEGMDVLMLPVGGTYTLDAAQAADLVRALKPRVTIPMHFKKADKGFQNIDSSDPFLKAMLPVQASHQPLLRVTSGDISEAPPLVVLEANRE